MNHLLISRGSPILLQWSQNPYLQPYVAPYTSVAICILHTTHLMFTPANLCHSCQRAAVVQCKISIAVMCKVNQQW